MSITVVGSVAYDSVETPAGRYERKLAGAATYFSLAASFFTKVRVIAVVGEDFGPEQEAVFKARNIDTRGIEHTAGKSFFWEGSYLENINEAKTHNTELNVFAAFEPKIPDVYRDSDFLFLANIDPVLQRRVRDAMPGVKLVAGDTMNYWIKDHRPALLEVLKGLDVLLINDTEARMLAGNNNLVQAARGVMALGPRALVVKHGEYGATLFHEITPKRGGRSSGLSELRHSRSKRSSIPPARATALPAASSAIWPRSRSSRPASWRHAMFYGSVMGSYACERFGTERLQQLSRQEIDERFNVFREITHLD